MKADKKGAKPGGKAAAPPISVAQQLHVDVDLRRLHEACGVLGDVFLPFAKRVRAELVRVKEGEQDGVPQVPLFVRGKTTYEDIQMLCTVALKPYPYLRVIQLHHCLIGDDGILILAEFLSQYKPPPDRNPFGIQCLELPGCNIGPTGCRFLTRFLSSSTTVEKVKLDFNPLGDEGALEISSALRWNASVTSLSMEYCSIGPLGAEGIASCVIKGSNVRILSLRGNPLGDVGIESLGQAMCVGTKLEEADFADTACGKDAESLESLCEAVEKSVSLTSLNIDLNVLAPSVAESLLAAVKLNKKVARLYVSERVDPLIYRQIVDTAASHRGTKKKKKKASAAKK